MALVLRDLVLRSLDALQLPYAAIAGGIEVRLPTALRRHFRDRERLRLVFDEGYWQHDRDAELVSIGSPFLSGLEALLRESCTLSVKVGGEWFVDPGSIEAFRQRVTILNGRLTHIREHIHLETAVSVLFEVSIPGRVERTELVPVTWSATRGVLAPEEVASLLSRSWYSPEEAMGLGSEVDPDVLASGRSACQQALASRLSPLMSSEHEERSNGLAREEERCRQEAQARREEAANKPSRLSEIDEEERERLARIARLARETWRVFERSVEVWQIARADAEACYLRTGDDLALAIPISRSEAGMVRSDLCGGCSRAVPRYFLAPRSSETKLLCEDCGGLCRGEGCSEIIALGGRALCGGCLRPGYCERHLTPCSQCGSLCCPEHGGKTDCCGLWLCSAHKPPKARDGRQLCGEHGAPCSVDDQWTAIDDLFACPVTGQRLYRGNAITLRDDPRELHPDAIVTCGTTHTPVALDRAARCAVDGAWHRVTFLEKIDGELVCQGHIAEVDVPKGKRVRIDRVVSCSETHAMLEQGCAGVCSVRGLTYDERLLVSCPLTGLRMHHACAISPPGDDRSLHPHAVLRCSESREWVARDRAIRDEMLPGEVWLSPKAAVRCAASGKWTARSRAVVADCCGRQVARAHTGKSPVSGKLWCRDHGILCEAHAANVLPSESVRCAITGKALCTEHTVRASCCERLVTRDKAVQLAGGRYGCHEHYSRCTAGHPLLASAARACSVCGGAVCPKHEQRDPYDSAKPCCERHISRCKRCGIESVCERGAKTCRWCAAATILRQEDPRWAPFQRLIWPLLPQSAWLVLARVRISGSPSLSVYEVSSPRSTIFYRMRGTVVEIKSPSGWRAV